MTESQHQQRHISDSRAETPLIDLPAYVSDLVRAVIRGIEHEMEPFEVSSLEYGVLRDCMDKGECTATELAEVLPVDPSRISRIVNTLVEKELLIRRRLSDDRRIVMLRLSDKGSELTSTLNRRVQEYNAKLMENISEDDVATFASVTHKILANHAAMEKPQQA